MAFHQAPFRILAHNGRNWYILHLGDGRVQLDFGSFAVAFPREAFQLIHGLVEAAVSEPTLPGCMAHAGVERSVWFDPQHGTILLVFEGMILRFLPHEAVAFVSLCREAGNRLGVNPTPPSSTFSGLN